MGRTMRVRKGSHSSLEKGKQSELAAVQWLEARGYSVCNVAGSNLMHDLEVVGLGKVQVKTCRKTLGGAYCRTPRVQCSLAQGNTQARYPIGAFEWLCCVFWLKDGPRLWLVSEKSLIVPGQTYLKDAYIVPLGEAMTRWAPMQEQDLWSAA